MWTRKSSFNCELNITIIEINNSVERVEDKALKISENRKLDKQSKGSNI